MRDLFEVGKRYTRADIFRTLGMREFPSGGNWFTGYHQHTDGRWFIFSHLGTAGRTGHDYGDHRVPEGLFWRGKTGSHVAQPSIRSLTSGDHPVHVFTREDDRSPFEYQGPATALRVEDTVPVTIIWRFNPHQ